LVNRNRLDRGKTAAPQARRRLTPAIDSNCIVSSFNRTRFE
jgi:hypothetical protein